MRKERYINTKHWLPLALAAANAPSGPMTRQNLDYLRRTGKVQSAMWYGQWYVYMPSLEEYELGQPQPQRRYTASGEPVSVPPRLLKNSDDIPDIIDTERWVLISQAADLMPGGPTRRQGIDFHVRNGNVRAIQWHGMWLVDTRSLKTVRGAPASRHDNKAVRAEAMARRERDERDGINEADEAEFSYTGEHA